jgi:hypothetical protein
MTRETHILAETTQPPSSSSPFGTGFALLACLAAAGLLACAQTVPKRFIQQAEKGVTLTSLTAKPSAYQGKTVILGGVIVEQREEPGRIWLLMKNRPLDEEYMPHRDVTAIASESGYYWVIVERQNLPKNYMDWARVTSVGWVTDQKPPKSQAAQDRSHGGEPVLDGIYLLGWGYGNQRLDVWEDKQDANYIQSNPLQELRQ